MVVEELLLKEKQEIGKKCHSSILPIATWFPRRAYGVNGVKTLM